MLKFGLLFASVILMTEVAAFSFNEMTADEWMTHANFLTEKASVDGSNLCKATGGEVSLDEIGDFTLVNAESEAKLEACATTVLGPDYSFLNYTCFIRLEFGSRFAALSGTTFFSYQCTIKDKDCFLYSRGGTTSERVSLMLTSGQRSDSDYFYCQLEAVQGSEGSPADGPSDGGPPDDSVPDDGPYILDTCDCGTSVASRIVGGEFAEENEYPFAAALIITTYFGTFFCGGTLVSDSFILTAAHCTHSNATIIGLLGENSLSAEGGMVVSVEQMFPHPDYDDQTLMFDVALLKLETAVDFASNPRIRPVCLPQGCDSYAGTYATAIGWGLTDFNETHSDLLLEVEVPVINNGDCRQIWGDGSITDSTICAGESGRGTCFGDSGSALLSGVSGPYLELIGVTSFGNSFCDQLAGGFGRVTNLLPWIYSIISDSSTCQTPSYEGSSISRAD